MRNDEIRKRIRDLRQRRGISQKDFAEAVGMKASNLCELETGTKKGSIHMDDLPKFAEALGVSEYYLLTGVEDENRDVADLLHLSNETIDNLKAMDEETLKAFELLINNEWFGMAWMAYLSRQSQGLWKNGRQIASGSEDITLGNIAEYSGTFNVDHLVSIMKEQELISTMRTIRGGLENETGKR